MNRQAEDVSIGHERGVQRHEVKVGGALAGFQQHLVDGQGAAS